MRCHREGTNSVVVAGPFPPPISGLSKNTGIIASDLASRARVIKTNIGSGTSERTVWYHARKARRVLIGFITILRNGIRQNPCLYIAADGRNGLAYTLILVLAARVTKHEIYIQYRSFYSIDRSTSLMRVLVRLSGASACHIFLCPFMKERFIWRYPGVLRTLVASNAYYAVPRERRRSPGSFLSIGLLSNLDRSKGLYLFLDVLRTCRQKGLPVRGILAGPVSTPGDHAAVLHCQSELPGVLEYRDAVEGRSKEEFYDDVDVFVFPTTYANEAQPNVLFEAMSHHVAVVTFGRGCITEDVTPACGLVVETGADFVAATVRQIEVWCRNTESLLGAQAASAKRLCELHRAAANDYGRMIDLIAGVER